MRHKKSANIFFYSIVLIMTSPGILFSSEMNKEIVIPYQLSEGSHLILIDLDIDNSGKYNFIFDTGASASVLGIDTYNKLKEKGIEFKKAGIQKMHSPGGKELEVPVVMMEHLKLQTHTLRDIRAIVIPLPKIPGKEISGILSINDIETPAVRIDYLNKNIHLLSKERNISEGIPYNQSGIIEFEISINNQNYKAHLDTGSPAFVSIPYSWESQFEFIKEPVLAGKGMIGTNEITIYSAQIKGDLAIGEITLRDPSVELTEGGFQAVNFGYRFLKDKVITINKDKRIFKIEDAK